MRVCKKVNSTLFPLSGTGRIGTVQYTILGVSIVKEAHTTDPYGTVLGPLPL